MKNQSVLERFMEKVQKQPDGCWNFTSSIGSTGCGRFFYKGKCRDAYRVGYEFLVGELHTGQHLHHTCENRLCVNPDHLVIMTQLDHTRLHKVKTLCKRGHELTEENRVPPHGACRECARSRIRDFMRAKRSRLRENRV